MLTYSDGKSYKTDCANTQATFHINQSYLSPKAKTIKRWPAAPLSPNALNAVKMARKNAQDQVKPKGIL